MAWDADESISLCKFRSSLWLTKTGVSATGQGDICVVFILTGSIVDNGADF